eukprot:3475140-Rhodomonas_salina.2
MTKASDDKRVFTREQPRFVCALHTCALLPIIVRIKVVARENERWSGRTDVPTDGQTDRQMDGTDGRDGGDWETLNLHLRDIFDPFALDKTLL